MYLLQSRDHWNKHYDAIDFEFIKSNYPELYQFFFVAEQLYESERTEISLDELEIEHQRNYPRRNGVLFESLVERLRTIRVSDQTIQGTLATIKTKRYAASIAKAAIAVADGDGSREALDGAINDYRGDSDLAGSTDSTTGDEDFVTDDLGEILNEEVATPGIRWRLPSLNKYLGSLRKGDFGFVFARPETGKTTFLASELTYMAEQDGDDPIIWFNNEERGTKVMKRIYMASLGMTEEEILRDVESNTQHYVERTRNRIRLVDDAGLTAKKVERIIQQYRPRLVVFDQIDKITGFSSDRSDLELASIYKWARGLAKEHCPVIGICQAGATGDGKKWLTMNDVDNSKTGKQAEADWILGIGKTYDNGLEYIRYFHLSKNKLSGEAGMDPEMRHGKWEVRIDPFHARYADL